MDDGRYMHTIFCDDVRQEVGNKVSFMGIYGPQMFVANIPWVLPKICIAIDVRTPVGKPFKQLKFRLFRGDDLLSETDVPDETLAQNAPRLDVTDTHYLAVGFVAQIGPIVVNEPFLLRARAITETEELRGAALSIELAPPGTKPA